MLQARARYFGFVGVPVGLTLIYLERSRPTKTAAAFFAHAGWFTI